MAGLSYGLTIRRPAHMHLSVVDQTPTLSSFWGILCTIFTTVCSIMVGETLLMGKSFRTELAHKWLSLYSEFNYGLSDVNPMQRLGIKTCTYKVFHRVQLVTLKSEL